MINVGDIWNFALNQSLFGQQVINTFALKVTAIGQVVQEEAWLQLLFNHVNGLFNQADNLRDEIAQQQTAEVTHVSWLAKRVNANPTGTFVMGLAPDTTGKLAGTAETSNVSMSIQRKGLGPGRANRGRIQIAGIPTANYAAGIFTPNTVAEAQGVWPRMIGSRVDVTFGEFDLGWSHLIKLTGVWIHTKAVTGKAMSTVRVQRSRTVGVGS